MIIRNKIKYIKSLNTLRSRLQWFLRALWNEIAMFVIWGMTMFLLLVAIIGDTKEKLEVLDLFNIIIDFGVKVYAIAIGILVIGFAAYLILKLILYLDKKHG